MGKSAATLSNTKKVALLMVSLGKESVQTLAPYFTEKELKEISQCIHDMEEVDPSVVSEIVKEFYHKLSPNPEDVIAPGLSDEINTEEVLNILENVEPKQLVDYLQNEPLISIATMFSYLEPMRCTEILKEFPWDQQRALLLIFDQVPQHDPASKLKQMGLAKFLSAIISYLNQDAKQSILEEMELHHPALFIKIANILSGADKANDQLLIESGADNEQGKDT